jgi:hypothetical protein
VASVITAAGVLGRIINKKGTQEILSPISGENVGLLCNTIPKR